MSDIVLNEPVPDTEQAIAGLISLLASIAARIAKERATASALDTENAKLAAAVQSLHVQLTDERRASAWFEAAACAAGEEAAALRAENERLKKIADHHYFNCEGTTNDD